MSYQNTFSARAGQRISGRDLSEQFDAIQAAFEANSNSRSIRDTENALSLVSLAPEPGPVGIVADGSPAVVYGSFWGLDGLDSSLGLNDNEGAGTERPFHGVEAYFELNATSGAGLDLISASPTFIRQPISDVVTIVHTPPDPAKIVFGNIGGGALDNDKPAFMISVRAYVSGQSHPNASRAVLVDPFGNTQASGLAVTKGCSEAHFSQVLEESVLYEYEFGVDADSTHTIDAVYVTVRSLGARL